nr:MAG TPA: hypothetical protein [Caudoviricetes sp.]
MTTLSLSNLKRSLRTAEIRPISILEHGIRC